MNVEFWFKCPICGKYRVTEKKFMLFIPLPSRNQLVKKIKQGAVGVVVEFDSQCPKCFPKGASKGTVKVLWSPGYKKRKG